MGGIMRIGKHLWTGALAVVGLGWGLSAHAAPSVCDAVAGNLVTNCGFETGNFSGWTTVDAPPSASYYGVDHGTVNSGAYAAYFGSVETGVYDAINQSIATTPGVTYDVSFFLFNSFSSGSPNNGFSATFGIIPILTLFDAGQIPYTEYSTNIAATGTTTVLNFAGYNPQAAFYLDDVSVVALGPSTIPEPATLATFGVGLLGLAVKRRGRNR